MAYSPPARLAIIGAGMSATACVGALRACGFNGQMSVFGAEGLAPYDRPPLSKELLARTRPAWLAQEVGTDVAELADAFHPDEPVLQVLHHETEPAGNFEVQTASGSHFFDAVVGATGSRPIVPVWAQGAETLGSWADAVRLRARLLRRPGQRVILVGAGWIGLELASVLSAAGHQVTVLESAQMPLQQALGLQVGARLVPWLVAAGVDFRPGANVLQASAQQVTVADSGVLEADVVICAVGARPELGWLSQSLTQRLVFTPSGAVRTDAWGMPLPGEHSAVEPAPVGLWFTGDCAAVHHPLFESAVGGHWDAALQGGQTTARLIALGEAAAGPLKPRAPYVFSDQFGHHLALFGVPEPGSRPVFFDPPDAAGWLAVWLNPLTNQASAVLCVDLPRQVGLARRLFAAEALPVLDPQQLAATGLPRSA